MEKDGNDNFLDTAHSTRNSIMLVQGCRCSLCIFQFIFFFTVFLRRRGGGGGGGHEMHNITL
jgi:hypothetical protein